MIFVGSSMEFSVRSPLKGRAFFNIDISFFVANLHHVMRYFPFLQYVMRFCSGTSKATDDGGIIKVGLVSKQSLSPLSLATFDSASRQRRSRRRLAALTSTQGSRKIAALSPRRKIAKKPCEKNQNRVGTDALSECRVIREQVGGGASTPRKSKKISAKVQLRSALVPPFAQNDIQ